jgi:hypothetical protein
MGGTGLEPVTPSLSSSGGRSLPFTHVRYMAPMQRFYAPGPNASEAERTLSAAIAATLSTSRLAPYIHHGRPVDVASRESAGHSDLFAANPFAMFSPAE